MPKERFVGGYERYRLLLCGFEILKADFIVLSSIIARGIAKGMLFWKLRLKL